MPGSSHKSAHTRLEFHRPSIEGSFLRDYEDGRLIRPTRGRLLERLHLLTGDAEVEKAYAGARTQWIDAELRRKDEHHEDESRRKERCACGDRETVSGFGGLFVFFTHGHSTGRK
jgi:hypothetical protein